MKKADREKLERVLKRAQKAAIEYYELTGKPLGITGEIGECLAAKCLNLELTAARSAGHDAIEKKGRKLIQIKTRKLAGTNTRKTGRVGAIKFDHKWHTAILVLLDDRFELMAMYEATRAALKKELSNGRSNNLNTQSFGHL